MRFSIITVTYNAGQTLQSTLDSIRCQDFSDYELVIVDGLSKDNTLDIIKRNIDIISLYISEKDKGIYDAMNKGINIASGDYCLFLNAGDCLYSQKTLSQVDSYISNFSNQDLYIGYADYTDGKKVWSKKPNLTKLPFTFCHQAMFFSTALIKKNKYNVNYKLSGDSELLYRFIEMDSKIKVIDVKVVLEESGRGATHSNLFQSTTELYNIGYLKSNMSIFHRSYKKAKIAIYLVLRNLFKL